MKLVHTIKVFYIKNYLRIHINVFVISSNNTYILIQIYYGNLRLDFDFV